MPNIAILLHGILFLEGGYLTSQQDRRLPGAAQGQKGESKAISNGGVKGQLAALLAKRWFEPLIIAVIVLNAIMIGLETSPSIMARYGEVLAFLDKIVLGIFVVEIASRIFVYGRAFWRDPWSLFDFFTVAVTMVPATGNLSILRSLRIIRALRLVSAIPSMRRVVAGLLSAIPGMGSVMLLLLLLLYVSSVMATQLYGALFPEFFGNIGRSAYSLFQIMTLEGWSGEIVRPVMAKEPWAWLFFIPFIIISTFMVLNLFLGIVVDAIGQQTDVAEKEVVKAVGDEHHQIMTELAALRVEIAALQNGTAASANAATSERPQPPGAGSKRKRRRKRRS